ncbi:hypothetical protein ACFVVU_19050 [Kitasatospora sp. NPDC057965]|uniref:hypothetical protein n=1 Tax=unclassified Kitasatospora TaxID=2633591 RepID=UPI0036B0DC22
MVVPLEGEGDPDEHAAYPDRDTAPLAEALRIVGHIVATGSWPPDTPRVADR